MAEEKMVYSGYPQYPSLTISTSPCSQQNFLVNNPGYEPFIDSVILYENIKNDNYLVMLKKLVITGLFSILTLFPSLIYSQNDGSFAIARIQYRGGGDWYNTPSSLTNLIEFTKNQVPISIRPEYDDVQLGSRDIFNYPFLFMTGHGNIAVNDSEMENLREYLENGGFLYVDDDYGMDQYVRKILQNIFPDERFFELPGDHPIYSNVYNFPEGRPPKVHEHDGKTPQAFAVYRKGRMVLLYTYESNPSDGWAYDEFDNPQDVTDAALQFGVNLLVYALTNP